MRKFLGLIPVIFQKFQPKFKQIDRQSKKPRVSHEFRQNIPTKILLQGVQRDARLSTQVQEEGEQQKAIFVVEKILCPLYYQSIELNRSLLISAPFLQLQVMYCNIYEVCVEIPEVVDKVSIKKYSRDQVKTLY